MGERREPSCLQLDEQSDYITKFKDIKKTRQTGVCCCGHFFRYLFALIASLNTIILYNYFLTGKISGERNIIFF